MTVLWADVAVRPLAEKVRIHNIDNRCFCHHTDNRFPLVIFCVASKSYMAPSAV